MPLLGSGDFSPVQVQRFEKARKAPPARLGRFMARVKTLNREVLCGWPEGMRPDIGVAVWIFDSAAWVDRVWDFIPAARVLVLARIAGDFDALFGC